MIFFGEGCSFFGCFYVIIIVRPQDPFEALLHRYRGLLFSLCQHYRRRGLEVDDLLQEASVALWHDSGRLLTMGTGPQQAALVWKIGRNAMIDALRRTPETEGLPEGYEEAEEDRSLADELQEHVRMMDEPDKTLVTMQLSGYSYEEIASTTGLTVKNVSVRLVRAKEKLKSKFI